MIFHFPVSQKTGANLGLVDKHANAIMISIVSTHSYHDIIIDVLLWCLALYSLPVAMLVTTMHCFHTSHAVIWGNMVMSTNLGHAVPHEGIHLHTSSGQC